jgi:hypothetical protein
MALVFNDRVQQTGTANTTVSFTLSGAVAGFQSFSIIGNTNTTYYSATDASGNWEVGIGTYSTTGPTLTRTTILSSSNAGAAVTFAGAVSVWCDYPAGKVIIQDASGNVMVGSTVYTGSLVTTTNTQTLTNKRITPRILADTSDSATPTINTDNYDAVIITGQTNAITSFTTNLTGTPTNGQKLWVSITGTTAIAITWGASFESSTVLLPTTTVTTARLDVGFVWNVATSTWRCVGAA